MMSLFGRLKYVQLPVCPLQTELSFATVATPPLLMSKTKFVIPPMPSNETWPTAAWGIPVPGVKPGVSPDQLNTASPCWKGSALRGSCCSSAAPLNTGFLVLMGSSIDNRKNSVGEMTYKLKLNELISNGLPSKPWMVKFAVPRPLEPTLKVP